PEAVDDGAGSGGPVKSAGLIRVRPEGRVTEKREVVELAGSSSAEDTGNYYLHSTASPKSHLLNKSSILVQGKNLSWVVTVYVPYFYEPGKGRWKRSGCDDGSLAAK